jgi:hypothetical protein
MPRAPFSITENAAHTILHQTECRAHHLASQRMPRAPFIITENAARTILDITQNAARTI